MHNHSKTEKKKKKKARAENQRERFKFHISPPPPRKIHSFSATTLTFTVPTLTPSIILQFASAHAPHYDSFSTPANPLSTSPTPIPSLPAFSLLFRSRSSSRFDAVPKTRSATRSAEARNCSILWTPSAKRSMFGSRE